MPARAPIVTRSRAGLRSAVPTTPARDTAASAQTIVAPSVAVIPLSNSSSNSLPGLITDSDLSLDSIDPYLIAIMLCTSSPTVGAFQQATLTKPPVLTAGDVTPEALCSWEIGCITYFAHKDVTPASQVQRVAWGLHDARIQQWYVTEHNRLNTLTFATFMTEL